MGGMGTGSLPFVQKLSAHSLLKKESPLQKEAPIYKATIVGKAQGKKTKEFCSKLYTVHLVAAANKAAKPSKAKGGKTKRIVCSKTDHKEGTTIFCTQRKGVWHECDAPSSAS